MGEINEPKTHVYLETCGCLAIAIVDVPEMFEELGKAAHQAKKYGYVYKLMETADVRKMPWKCDAHKRVSSPKGGK